MDEMFAELRHARAEVLPGEFWKWHNARNIAQLERSGYETFKQTAALSYFTFVSGRRDPQIDHLLAMLAPVERLRMAGRALRAGKHPLFSIRKSYNYNLLTHLVWNFARRHDPERLLDRLHEPDEGSPPQVRRDGRLISQDLANSMLEYRAIMDGGVQRDKVHTMLELGAGYGRTSYVFLSLELGMRVVVVDIPPALYLAERYLSSQFRDRKIFRFRPFRAYADVAAEFESADIAFLLPHQLELLPAKSVQLFVNISSLHEMRRDQIAFYLGEIDRLTSGWFYCKQWRSSVNAKDGIVVKEEEYGFPAHWRSLWRRDAPVQHLFFEQLFAI